MFGNTDVITMATIKAYTDLEQSKKLAEFLLLESADQTWARIAIAGANLDVPEEMQYRHNGDMPFQYYSGIGIPCWSLAALLDVLPYCPDLSKHTDGKWYITTYPNDVHTCLMAYDNPVDACYEMIIKLHELKML